MPGGPCSEKQTASRQTALASDTMQWPDKVAAAAIRLLVAAIAIYYAVCYIHAVWKPLIVIAAVGAAISAVVYAIRHRHQGW